MKLVVSKQKIDPLVENTNIVTADIFQALEKCAKCAKCPFLKLTT